MAGRITVYVLHVDAAYCYSVVSLSVAVESPAKAAEPTERPTVWVVGLDGPKESCKLLDGVHRSTHGKGQF